MDAAAAICRFLFYCAALFLWGSGIYQGLLVPRELRGLLWERMAAARGLAIVVLLMSTIAILPVRTAIIGGDWLAAADGEMLLSVATGTNIGTAWSVQLVVSTLLALALVTLSSSTGPTITALLAGILLASLSLTGHAVMKIGWVGIGQQVNNTLHVLAGGAWVGALPVVVVLLSQMRGVEFRSLAVVALRRFSIAGHVAVAMVVVSGGISTLLITGRFPPEPTSLYQQLLLIKIVIVAAMVLIAMVNRYVFVPQLRTKAGSIRAIVAGTWAEVLLVAAVIGLVATFGMMEPGI